MNRLRIQNLCLIADSSCNHSYIYLKELISKGVIPAQVIVLNIKNEQLTPRRVWLKRLIHDLIQLRQIRKIFVKMFIYVKVHSKDIHVQSLALPNLADEKLLEIMRKIKYCAFIYTCGGFVPSNFFTEENFRILHCHLGYLPDFRGSDCLTWSALIDTKIGASVFYMNENIDNGELISRMKMPILSYDGRRLAKINKTSQLDILNKKMDPRIRAQFLAFTLTKYIDTDFRKIPTKKLHFERGQEFFWLHPKLRKLINALLVEEVQIIPRNANLVSYMSID